jgi:ubiquinone/menaquinone biosynthesis C-methylase UbiE
MAEPVVGEEMRAYYATRAREYDDWWLGSGLYAERERPGWREEVAALIRALASMPPARTLDVACGTGFLTFHFAGEVTAIDQSTEMVEIAAARLPKARVLRAEAVPLPFADAAFDRLVTSHFYGHLVGDEASRFLNEARRVARELVIVDSALRPDSPTTQWQERTLKNGSKHRVFKRYFTAEGLRDELGDGETVHSGDWFVAVRARTNGLYAR